MFRFFLVDEQGQVPDPAGFVTTVPNWNVGETFTTGRGEEFRIVAIETEIADELVDAGFNGIFIVEQLDE